MPTKAMHKKGICMKGKHTAAWVTAVVCVCLAATSRAETVVSIRYLQPMGVSHAHLYLYRDNGRMVRQLTTGDMGQDVEPVFSADGRTIAYAKEMPRGARQYWTVSAAGGSVHRLNAAPKWYIVERGGPRFVPELELSCDSGAAEPRFCSPNGTYEIVLAADGAPSGDDGKVAHASDRLREVGRGSEVAFGSIPGFEGAFGPLVRSDDKRQCFLQERPLQVAFLWLHLNSTDGDTSYALDIPRRRFVRLSPNWATPVPLPGEPAFLTLTFVRYLPIAGSRMTANCTYLERWDSRMQKVRYARKGAALCYGASVYRPGKQPAVVTVRRENR